MRDRSRRRVLGAIGTALVGVAGCTNANSGDTLSDTPSPTEAVETDRAYDHCIHEPPSAWATGAQDTPPLTSSSVDPDWGWSDAEWLVTTRHQRDALDYSPEAEGIEAVRTFVEDTNLLESAILVNQYAFPRCSEYLAKRVKWRPADYSDGYDVAVEYEEAQADGTGTHTTGDSEHSDQGCRKAGPDPISASLIRVPAEIDAIAGLRWASFPVGRKQC